MAKGHLEASLREDLEEIRHKVVEMGGMAEAAVRGSIRAVLGRDRQVAYAVTLPSALTAFSGNAYVGIRSAPACRETRPGASAITHARIGLAVTPAARARATAS